MPKLSKKYDEALQYVSEVHREQARKGTSIPYLTHLMAVSALVGEHGGDEEQMIAALLHDAMEDQGVTRKEIEKRFGGRVADIVEGCTDTTEVPKPPWKQRKKRYIAHLQEASSDTKLISASDKLHNARSILADLRVIGSKLWSRFSAGPDGIFWYYRALIEAFRNGWEHPLIDELERVVNEAEQIHVGCANAGAST